MSASNTPPTIAPPGAPAAPNRLAPKDQAARTDELCVLVERPSTARARRRRGPGAGRLRRWLESIRRATAAAMHHRRGSAGGG